MTNTATNQHLQTAEELFQEGRYAEAIESLSLIYEPATPLPRRELWLARCFHKLWHVDQAETLYRSAHQLAKDTLGEQHSIVASALDGLGKLYIEQGEAQRAAPLLEEAHILRQLIFGVEHPDTAESLLRLAELFTAQKRPTTALPFYQESIRILRTIGTELQISVALNCFGYFQWTQSRLPEALSLLLEANKLQEALREKHPTRGSILWNLALVYQQQGQLDLAMRELELAFGIFCDAFGSRHPKTYCSLSELASLYRLVGRMEDATKLYRSYAMQSPIREEAEEFISQQKLKKALWRTQKSAAGQLFSLPIEANHLSLSGGSLLISANDAVRVCSLPLKAKGAQETISTPAGEAYALPEDEVLVLSSDRLLHRWKKHAYDTYLGALPQGPLVFVEPRRQFVCLTGDTVSLLSLEDLSEIAQQKLSMDGAEILPPVPSSSLLVVGAMLGQTVFMLQLDTLEEVDSFEVQGGLRAITATKDTIYAATESWVCVYQHTQEDTAETSAWALNGVVPEHIAVSADGATLAISTKDELLFFSPKTHQETAKLPIREIEQIFFDTEKRYLFIRTPQMVYALLYK
jgi:tetratricopeptide (TPR) repeat protein